MQRRYVSAIILAALVLSWGMRFEIVKTDRYPWVLDHWTGQAYMADTLLSEVSDSEDLNSMKKARIISNLISGGASVLAVVLLVLALMPEGKMKPKVE